MKKCPQCGREYDTSMMFCLDDGAELLYGPASSDEPATVFLEAEPRTILVSSTERQSLSAHRAAQPQEVTTDRAAQPQKRDVTRAAEPSGLIGTTSANPPFAKPLVALIATALILVGGFVGYRYFASASSKQISSIAVMPFVNDSGDSSLEYLSDGMTESLIRTLSQLPGLNVKSRSSVFRYKGKETDAKSIAGELGVQAILNGRVVQRGDALSLNLELIDPSNENVIWTDRYDRKASDIISLQNDIARDVSNKLSLKLSGSDASKLAKNYTTDPEAYRLYLQGRFYWNKRAGQEFEKSESYFRRSIEKDPNFALGYVGLADYYSDRDRAKAKENVNRALEIDDNLAEAHGTRGYQYMLDYNWTESERHMKRALEIDPKNNAELYRWNGQRLMMLGRYDESLNEYKRALDIDPNSTPVHFIYGSCLIASGQLDKGIEYLENAIKADPTFVWSHSQLSFGYRFKNDFARATEQRAIAQDLLGETENAKLTRESFAKGGRDGFLREMIRQGNNPDGITGGMRTASSYALLGENETAISTLQKLAEGGDFWLFQIKYDPAYENLKTDPRFQELLKIFDVK